MTIKLDTDRGDPDLDFNELVRAAGTLLLL